MRGLTADTGPQSVIQSTVLQALHCPSSIQQVVIATGQEHKVINSYKTFYRRHSMVTYGHRARDLCVDTLTQSSVKLTAHTPRKLVTDHLVISLRCYSTECVML